MRPGLLALFRFDRRGKPRFARVAQFEGEGRGFAWTSRTQRRPGKRAWSADGFARFSRVGNGLASTRGNSGCGPRRRSGWLAASNLTALGDGQGFWVGRVGPASTLKSHRSSASFSYFDHGLGGTAGRARRPHRPINPKLFGSAFPVHGLRPGGGGLFLRAARGAGFAATRPVRSLLAAGLKAKSWPRGLGCSFPFHVPTFLASRNEGVRPPLTDASVSSVGTRAVQ